MVEKRAPGRQLVAAGGRTLKIGQASLPDGQLLHLATREIIRAFNGPDRGP